MRELAKAGSTPVPDPGPEGFTYVRVGDTVRRMLAGTVPMDLKVTEVDETLIYCGARDMGWTFDRRTGAEVDTDLGWGPEEGITGSYLVGVIE